MGRKIYTYLHISITCDFCHYFLLCSEQNDTLENYSIDLFHVVFLFTFLVHQMKCIVVFPNHYIELHLMYVPFKISKLHEKGLIRSKPYFFIPFEDIYNV